MDGIFYKRKGLVLFDIIGIVSGVSLILLFGYFLSFQRSDIPEENYVAVFFILFGITSIIISIYTLFYNKNAFLHIDGTHISAQYSHRKQLECDIEDIAYISYQNIGISTNLTIVLNNKKKHNILYLDNAVLICKYIRMQMPFNYKNTTKEQAIAELQKSKSLRKKLLIAVGLFIALMFGMIFLAVFLTNGKEIADFNNTDRLIFNGMIVAEILNFSILMFLAVKAGHQLNTIQEKEFALRRNIIYNETLLSGNVLDVFTDFDYYMRVTVFGFPNSNNIYYCIEEINNSYKLVKIYTSPIYEDYEEIEDELTDFIKINNI